MCICSKLQGSLKDGWIDRAPREESKYVVFLSFFLSFFLFLYQKNKEEIDEQSGLSLCPSLSLNPAGHLPFLVPFVSSSCMHE